MAVLCLANNLQDLKERLGKIIVAYDFSGNPVTADMLQATGAMTALLKDAMKPNLIQTLEHTPVSYTHLQFMVDVSDIPEVKFGDKVTLIGSDQEEYLPVEKLSELSGRFNYEFVCDLGKRIPRVYVQDGKVEERCV